MILQVEIPISKTNIGITSEVIKNWQNHLTRLIVKVWTIFCGITSDPTKYPQEEFWGVTQELVQPDGQTSPHKGQIRIPVRLLRIGKTI